MITDRIEYIRAMDSLMLRQPLWLQMPRADYYALSQPKHPPLACRLPTALGLLVHFYDGYDGAPMVEVNVDLDDSFDARRAALPLGGDWSVRFPGGRPTDREFRDPPSDMPEPGRDIAPPEADPDPPSAAAPDLPLTAPTTDEPRVTNYGPNYKKRIEKLKVAELKAELVKRQLPTDGLKPALCERLLEAVRSSQVDAENDSEEELTEEQWEILRIISRDWFNVELPDGSTVKVAKFDVQWQGTDPNTGEPWPNTEETEHNLEISAHQLLHEFLAKLPKADGCAFGHTADTCRCGRPLIISGQDESIFKAYQVRNFVFD